MPSTASDGPPIKTKGPRRYVVGRRGELPDGERRIVEIAGKSIGIFNVRGKLYALLNRCPHQAAELCKGDVLRTGVRADAPGEMEFDAESCSIICPWHGWEYDLATGKSFFDGRASRVRAYDVELEHGEELARELERAAESGERVPGPYVADVIEVAVEDDYIVVTI